MRILIPTHAFTDRPQSGLHTTVWNTVRCLAENGHEVFVLSTWTKLEKETKASLKSKGIFLHELHQFPVHNLGKPVALRCFFAACFLRMRKRFDWIYVIDTATTPFARFKLGAALATRILAPKTPEVQHLLTTGDWWEDRQNKDVEEGWKGRKKPLWYRAFSFLADVGAPLFFKKNHYDNADLVFCQGHETCTYWKNRIPAHTAELPNGIETRLFDAAGEAPRKTDRFVFLFVGRIVRRKGIFYLLEAFENLRNQHDNIELWIVGRGAEDLIGQMQIYCKRDPDHIRYFGEVNRENIAAFFHHCSVLVDPMIYQGFSTVCLEALYCGKPVIASKFGGTKDVVTEREGILVDPRNVEELKRAMEKLCSNSLLGTGMGEHGKEKAMHYKWEDVITIVEKEFSALRTT